MLQSAQLHTPNTICRREGSYGLRAAGGRRARRAFACPRSPTTTPPKEEVPKEWSDLHAAVFAGVSVGVRDPNDGVVLVVGVFQVIGATCRRKLMPEEVT